MFYKYISRVEYDKIDDYVERSIGIIEDSVNRVGKLKYGSRNTVKGIIDSMNESKKNSTHLHSDNAVLWFDEYWFFKYDGMIDYASLFKGDRFYERDTQFFELLPIYNEYLCDCEFFYQRLPFEINTVMVTEEFFYRYDRDDDDHIFNVKSSINALKRYILNDLPRIERQCRFEYGLTHDITAYNKLSIAIFALIDLVKYLDEEEMDLICYSENSLNLLYSLKAYLIAKRNEVNEYTIKGECPNAFIK